MRRLSALAALVVLAAAVALAAAKRLPGPAWAHGVVGASALEVVSDHPHHVILARVLAADRAGGVAGARAVTLAHWRDGVHYLRLDAVHANGRVLPFRRLPPRPACLSAGHCPARTLGVVLVPDALVPDGPADGLAMRLHGTMGVVRITVPASLFVAAEDPV